MNSLLIEGGRPLSGEVVIAGNKNAALPMLAATLLTDEAVTLENVPQIRDVLTMQAVLGELGASVSAEGDGRLVCRTAALRTSTPPAQICQAMRASFVLAGPLLARGPRRAAARVIVCDPHRAVITGPCKLYGQTVSSPDIRAGMALLLAALVAEGTTTIHNAQQIDRGYERIEERLRALGANIQRVEARQP